MVVMTAKLHKKRLILILAALLFVIGLLCAIPAKETETVGNNPARVEYLQSLGLKVAPEPVETQEVQIPETPDPVFERYNALQKSQGFDLSAYAGKTVSRFVYPMEGEPTVFVTLLTYRDQVIGGDVTDREAGGVIRSLRQNP